MNKMSNKILFKVNHKIEDTRIKINVASNIPKPPIKKMRALTLKKRHKIRT